MKLPDLSSCHWEDRKGNTCTMTALGENRVNRFSDASSTLAASTNIKAPLLHIKAKEVFQL